MKDVLRIIPLILIFFFLEGCGPSNHDISESVKASMQQNFNSNPQFSKWHMTVAGVQVFKQGDNSYKGIATIMREGTKHDIPIQITIDGNNIMWEASPGSFTFLAQEELKKLFKQR